MPSQQEPHPEPLWYISQLLCYINLLEMNLQRSWAEDGTRQNKDEDRCTASLFKGDICFFMDTGHWDLTCHGPYLLEWRWQKHWWTDNRHLIFNFLDCQGQGCPAWLWETHSILNGVVHIEYLNGELPSQEKLGREWVQSYSIRVWDPVFSWWFLGRGDQAAKPDQCLSFTSLGTPSLTEIWKTQHTPVTNRDSSYWLELPC